MLSKNPKKQIFKTNENNWNKQNSKPKVDINQLLNRVRDEKKKERKENLLLLSLVGSVIVITGVIASL